MSISPLLALALQIFGRGGDGNATLIQNMLLWASMQRNADLSKYATEGDYFKCNEFVADAYEQIFGIDLRFDGRRPVVGELANGTLFTDQLTTPQSIQQGQLGDIVIWYDDEKDVHHSAILTGMPTSDPDTWTVTYAGTTGEVVKENVIGEMFDEEGVDPVVRRPK